MGQGWTRDESGMDRERTANGPRTDQGWTRDGPVTEKPDPYYIFNILVYMNKTALFFTFFDQITFSVSVIYSPLPLRAKRAMNYLNSYYALSLLPPPNDFSAYIFAFKAGDG